MYEYLKNLLPRVKQFSKDLDEKELFNDKHWVLVDDEGKRATYVFQRAGRLIVSLSGVPKLGTWEYISAAKSLLLTVGDDKAFLSFSFFNDALFVLKKDDDAETPWILVNKNVLPDLNIEKYLNSLLPEAERPDIKVELKLEDGIVLSISGVKIIQSKYISFKVSVEGKPIKNGIYKIRNQLRSVQIEHNKIIKYLFLIKYQTERGELIVQKSDECDQYLAERNDTAYFIDDPNPTGEFKLFKNTYDIKSLIINNGTISNIIFKTDWNVLIFGIVMIIALLSIAIFFALKTHA